MQDKRPPITSETSNPEGNIMVKKPKQRGQLAPDKYLSDSQVDKLRQYVKEKADVARQRGSHRNIINELVVELLLGSGIRRSGWCNLNIGDFLL